MGPISMVKHPRSQIGCYPEIEIRYRTYVASSSFRFARTLSVG